MQFFIGDLLGVFSVPLSRHLENIPAYVPGRSIEEVARELGMKEELFVKLASNENSLGPSKKALAAMKTAIKNSHVYPDGNYLPLKSKLAKKLGVEPKNIALGNGSNELIQLICQAMLSEGEEIVISQYCFAIYGIAAKIMKATPVVVPAKNYGHDLSAMFNAITPKTKIIFVTNPNNPTGTRVSNDELIEFVKKVPKEILVVVDEAYFEYLSTPADLVKFIRTEEIPNLVLLRTFSKIYGLAGLRIGYAIANPVFISVLDKLRAPFNVNVIVASAALAALDDKAHVKKTIEMNKKGMKFFESELKKLKLEFVPSSANFVMVKVGDGMGIFAALQKEGIIVRPVKNYSLPEWIRITVGTQKENKRCISALKKVLKKK